MIKYLIYFLIPCHARSLSLSRPAVAISPYLRVCVCALVYFFLFLCFYLDLALYILLYICAKLPGSEDNEESKKLAKKNYDWKFRVFTFHLFSYLA